MQIRRMVRYSLFVLLLLAIPATVVVPATAAVGVFIQVGTPPPPLPVYVQPGCPGDGYIWTPGYWAWGPDGYYWVPGTWVLAPEPGLLWTPGYWGWGGGFYVWHPGYWGPRVGFYGGINYGFGYFGTGYAGGYWSGRTFYYNRSVNNVTITNVHIYNRTVNNVTVNRVAYNGGQGGINRRASHEEERAEHERRFEATNMQVQHENSAKGNRDLWVSNNHGRPAIAATARPGDFHGHDVVPAREGGPHRPAENRGMENRPENRGRENRDNRGMNRDVPRPQNSERGAAERPMPREENRGRPEHNARPDNRGAENRMQENRVPENRGHGADRPGNGHQHESGPPQERGDKENKGHKPH